MSIIRRIFKTPLIGDVVKHQLLLRPVLTTYSKCYTSTKQTKKASSSDNDITDEPIKYSASLASKWKAADSRRGRSKYTRPEIEPYVIIISIATFMLYFCVLREENDIDEDLGRSLYSRIDGLEEMQLRNALRYTEEKGLDTQEIVKRLEEIQMEKKRSSEVVIPN